MFKTNFLKIDDTREDAADWRWWEDLNQHPQRKTLGRIESNEPDTAQLPRFGVAPSVA
ncbi:MAG: hypothetical protein NVS1B7_6250 [Candidatus Saccharimonadales bacterium]